MQRVRPNHEDEDDEDDASSSVEGSSVEVVELEDDEVAAAPPTGGEAVESKIPSSSSVRPPLDTPAPAADVTPSPVRPPEEAPAPAAKAVPSPVRPPLETPAPAAKVSPAPVRPPVEASAPGAKLPAQPPLETPAPAAKVAPGRPALETTAPAAKVAPGRPALETTAPAAKVAPGRPPLETPAPAAKVAPGRPPRETPASAAKVAPGRPPLETPAPAANVDPPLAAMGAQKHPEPADTVGGDELPRVAANARQVKADSGTPPSRAAAGPGKVAAETKGVKVGADEALRSGVKAGAGEAPKLADEAAKLVDDASSSSESEEDDASVPAGSPAKALRPDASVQPQEPPALVDQDELAPDETPTAFLGCGPEGLTEARLSAFKVEIVKTVNERVARAERLKDTDLYGEHNLWKKCLEPYDWRNITPKLMNEVLMSTNLAKGFTRQKQVRMYELLRCLGSDILELDLSAENPSDLERIKAHFRKYHVEKEDYWLREEDTIRVDLNQYFRDARGPPLPALAKTVIKVMGFSLQEVKSPNMLLSRLGAHVLDLLRRGTRLSPDAKDGGGFKPSESEVWLRKLARSAVDEQLPEADAQLARAHMLRFLQDVAEDYHRKSKAWQRHVDDDSLRGRVGKEPMNHMDQRISSTVRALLQRFTPEGQAPPAENLHELAPIQVRHVLKSLVYAWKCLGRKHDMPKKFNDWYAKSEANELGTAQFEEVARDLGIWFSANAKALALKEDATVTVAVSRALASLDERGVARTWGLGRGAAQPGMPVVGQKETVKDHVVAVFGSSRLEGQRLPVSASPVIVHRVPFNLSGDSGADPDTNSASALEIRELGVRLDGYYVEFTPESGSAQFGAEVDGKSSTEVRYYEWVPPGTVEETSKPLMRLLDEGVTHVRLVLPNVEDDDPVEVSLRDPCEVKADALTYKLIPSKPRDAAVLNDASLGGTGGSGSGGFRRFVLQVGRDLNISLPEPLRRGDGTGGAGFIETGAIVAQALRLFLGAKQSTEEITEHLQNAPDLLYFTSIALLESVSPNARDVVKIHWERKLRLDSPEVSRMNVPEREAREVLRDLLVAREAGRDKLCGVVPEAHCTELVKLLSTTKHALRTMSVESSNLDSRLGEIDSLITDSVICIVIITVTGRMDPAQVAQMIHRARGCVRLVFINYPTLLPSLALNQLVDRVVVPNSLEGLTTERIRPVFYSPSNAVGSVLCWSQAEFLYRPEGLTTYTQASIVSKEAELRRRFAWREEVDAWRLAGHLTDPLLLLISPDERHVEKHFLQGLKGSGKVYFFDDTSLPQMEKLVARTQHVVRRPDEGAVDASTDAPAVVVLSRVFFVKVEVLEALVKECFLKGFKLILILREILPDLLRVGVRAPGAVDRHVIAAAMIRVRSPATDLAAFSDHTALPALPVFRALGLAFGPEVASSDLAEKLVRADRVHDAKSLEDVAVEVMPKHAAELRELVQGMLREREDAASMAGVLVVAGPTANVGANEAGAKGAGTPSGSGAEGDGSMAFCVGRLLFAAAQQWEEPDKIISFPEFTQLPVCGFLPQVHRVEAWLRYLAGPLMKCPIPKLQGGSKHIVVSSFPPKQNVHGSSLTDELHAAGAPDPSYELPPPAYVGTGRLDVALSRDALYERCAMQGRDLDWESFAERWTQAYDLASGVMARMLRFSPDVGRLILSMPPSQIANLSGLFAERDTNFRILAHFEELRGLLRATQVSQPHTKSARLGHSALSKRFAAFTWVLRNSPDPEARERVHKLCGPLSAVELDTLVESHIMLRAGDNSVQMLRVVELLVRLDGDAQILGKQPEIREFLMRNNTEQFKEMLMKTKVGSNFIHFLLSAAVRAELLQGTTSTAIMKIPFFSDLLFWAAGRGTALGVGPLLTEAAMAAVIELAPKVSHLNVAGNLVWAHASNHDDPSAFVCTVLSLTLGRAPNSVVPLLEALAECSGDSELDLDLTSINNPLVPALWDALREENLAIFMEAFDPSSTGARLPLSMEGAPRLRALYLNHFAGSNGGPDLETHYQLLTDAGSSALYSDLMQLPAESLYAEHRLLLWQCWARCPARLLPHSALPQADDRQDFVQVLRRVEFWERCAEAPSLSVVARFLVEPFTLPFRVYNTVAQSLDFVHGGPIPEQILLVGQEGQGTFTAYFIRFHERPLPTDLKERIVGLYPKFRSGPGDGRSLKAYPRVTEGVSPEIVCHNLSVLFAMRNLQHEQGDSHVQRTFLGSTVMAWFGAAGLGVDDLEQCIDPEDTETFRALWNQLIEDFQDSSLRRNFVHGPLPSYIEVHWCESESEVPLFGVTQESANETAQWANTLKAAYALEMPEVLPEELVVKLADREQDLKEGPRLKGLLSELAQEVAKSLELRSKPSLVEDDPVSLVVARRPKEHDVSKLEDYMTVLVAFTRRLRGQGHQNEKRFLQELVKCMDTLPSESTAGIYTAFMSIFNATPLNLAREMGIIAEEYKRNNLKCSSQAKTEARTMLNQFREKILPDPDMTRNMKWLKDAEGCEFKRYAEQCDWIGEMLKDFNTSLWKETLEFRPIFRTPGGNGLVTASGMLSISEPEAELAPSPMKRKRHGALYDTGPDAAQEGEIEEAEDDLFFVAATADEHMGDSQRPTPLIALPSATKSVALVSARNLLKIDWNEGMYMHGVLRVRPGLQPLLRDDEDESFFRLAPIGPRGQKKGKKDTNIVKAFPNNGDAWDYLNQLPALSVIMCDGFNVVKAENPDILLPVLAAKHVRKEHGPPEDQLMDQRNFVWPLLHSAKMLRLDDDALGVLRIIVFVAFRLTMRSEAYLAECEAEEEDAPEDKKGLLASASLAPLDEDDLSTVAEPSEEDVRVYLDEIARRTVKGERAGNGDKQAQMMRKTLKVYHEYERSLTNLVRDTMAMLQEGHQDLVENTLRDVCYQAAGRLDSDGAGVHEAFIRKDTGHGMAPLGDALIMKLSKVMTQSSLFSTRSATTLWQALRLREHDRLVVPHQRLTKLSAARRAQDILRGVEKSSSRARAAPQWSEFSDSEDSDGEGTFGVDNPQLDRQQERRVEGNLGVGERELALFNEAADHEESYIDSPLDRRPGGAALLPRGFGRPVTSKYTVLSFYDADVPLYFIALSKREMQLSYSMASGLPLGFFLHKNLIAHLLAEAYDDGSSTGEVEMKKLREKLLVWLTDVLRSPLSDKMKRWILEKTEKKGLTATQPPQDPDARHVNLAVIAFCLCRCCPTDTPATRKLRDMLHKSWLIPRTVKDYISRKSDMYGIYIVKGGTLTDLKREGLHVAPIDFEQVVRHGTQTTTAMYLEIVRQFSDYCCIVYIQGLSRIQDTLLKWLAEYTKHHPWRFVYLENVDISWNYSENRDRCTQTFGPPNPSLVIQTSEELKSPHVIELRPSHTVSYDPDLLPPAEALGKPEELLTFFRDAFTTRSEEPPELLLANPPPSNFVKDWQPELRRYVNRATPSLVLLVSPPGAGKTFYMDQLEAQLQREQSIAIYTFDGSSDILVHNTLAELLNRAVTSRIGMLVVDEYHMLSDEHKDELYLWLQDRLGVLRVVLIANRIDSRDRDRLNKCKAFRHEDDSTPKDVRTVVLIQARLTFSYVKEVMRARSITERVHEAIGKWFVASRLIFGEESFSLRSIERLDSILSGDISHQQSRLEELLIEKVPTISRVSAEDFVQAFLSAVSLPGVAGGSGSAGTAGGEGPFAAMLKAALLDDGDEFCSLLEFLERTPRAYNALPPVRLLAWTAYMLNRATRSGKRAAETNIPLGSIMGAEFVDQVGVPFQLREAGGKGAHGFAFTWSGDYSSLDGLVDAVKHGHSINWADVGEKEWSRNPITDGDALCRLLSVTRNPSKLLNHLSAANLASLLRCSSARVANSLARYIIRNRSHANVVGADNPFHLAFWALLRNDETITSAMSLAQLVDDDASDHPIEMLHALIWAQQYAPDLTQTICEPRQRHRLLQRCLVHVTTRLPVERGTTTLWSGPFARLLLVPSQAPENDLSEKRRLPVLSFHEVLTETSSAPAAWRPGVQTMWRVFQGTATVGDVNELWRTETHLFFTRWDGMEAVFHGMPKRVVAGVLRAGGGLLAPDLQQALLTTNSELPDSIPLPQIVGRLSQAIRSVSPTELAIAASRETVDSLKKVLESNGDWFPPVR